MRNKYKGICYYCSKTVESGEGHFERYFGRWRTIHADCVFKQRAEKKELRIKADMLPQESVPDVTED